MECLMISSLYCIGCIQAIYFIHHIKCDMKAVVQSFYLIQVIFGPPSLEQFILKDRNTPICSNRSRGLQFDFFNFENHGVILRYDPRLRSKNPMGLRIAGIEIFSWDGIAREKAGSAQKPKDSNLAQ